MMHECWYIIIRILANLETSESINILLVGPVWKKEDTMAMAVLIELGVPITYAPGCEAKTSGRLSTEKFLSNLCWDDKECAISEDQAIRSIQVIFIPCGIACHCMSVDDFVFDSCFISCLHIWRQAIYIEEVRKVQSSGGARAAWGLGQ